MKRGVPAQDLISWGCLNPIGLFERTLYRELIVIGCSARRCGSGDHGDMFVTDTSARVPLGYHRYVEVQIRLQR